MKFNNSYRRITGSDGNMIGYTKGKTIYDSEGKSVFDIRKSSEALTKYIFYKSDNKLFGVINLENNCIYDTDRRYIGTIGRSSRPYMPLVITLIMTFLVTSSLYAMLDVTIKSDRSKSEKPFTIICMPKADGELDWSQNNTLNIFSQGVRTLPDGTTEQYKVKNSVAPEDTGMYGFILDNENERSIEYNISLSADNKYNIPIKYKLKTGKNYVVGDEDNWIDIRNFSANNLVLTKNSSMQFELYWKWESNNDENDTKIGTQELAEYMLTITLSAGYSK